MGRAVPRIAAPLAGAAFVFLFSWFFRFNQPGGSFAGLTDDHFFYLVRGWQILFGDLPVRDFVDQGAPLFYYVAAAVQWLGGRGTLSEIVFCVTVLSASAALTFWLAARASGSVVLGLLAAAVEVLLEPRFYNYPKILVYAVGIPLLWWFATRPTPRRLFWVALVTAIGALLRHDHGVFMGMATAVVLLLLRDRSWRDRLRLALVYAAFVAVLLLPYAVFVQANGGFGVYIRQASAWAERDRARAPVVWPGLFDNPDGVSDQTRESHGLLHAISVMRDNATAWLFYVELALPIAALILLGASADAFRPEWPRAREKMAMVAVLGLVLDAGFLRAPLTARLADPSVPLVILLAWLTAAFAHAVRGRAAMSTRDVAAMRAVIVVLVLPILAIVLVTMTDKLPHRLDQANLLDGPSVTIRKAEYIVRSYRETWPLERWSNPDDPGVMRLTFYVRDCTKPTDRVFMQGYMPEVHALAQRAFAGGNADLRPGFFTSDEAQELTVSRLQRQSVPIVVLDTGRSLENFRDSFPIVTRYLDAHYRVAGDRMLDSRFSVRVLVRADLTPTRRYDRLDLPCFN